MAAIMAQQRKVAGKKKLRAFSEDAIKRNQVLKDRKSGNNEGPSILRHL
jgi:hypothetical protein